MAGTVASPYHHARYLVSDIFARRWIGQYGGWYGQNSPYHHSLTHPKNVALRKKLIIIIIKWKIKIKSIFGPSTAASTVGSSYCVARYLAPDVLLSEHITVQWIVRWKFTVLVIVKAILILARLLPLTSSSILPRSTCNVSFNAYLTNMIVMVFQ